MVRIRVAGMALCAAGASACAGMPDVTVRYYHAAARSSVTLTRTIACSAKDHPIILTSVTPETVYSRDAGPPEELRLARLDGFLSTADMTFEFYGDGRLKAVNTTQKGGGAEVVKTAIGIAQLVTAADAGAPDPFAEACAALEEISDKPVPVVFHADIDFASRDPVMMKQATLAADAYKKVALIAGRPELTWEKKDEPAWATSNADLIDGPAIVLKHPAEYEVTLAVYSDALPAFTTSFVVAVPQHGVKYALPVQRAPLFGENRFELALTEDGRISKLKYGRTSGANTALGSANEAISAAEGETTADEAARLKAEADLIKARQRLVQCQADPANCQ